MVGEEFVDVLVVGAGIAGTAVCWELARRGHRTALCEQYHVDHAFGSSHGRSRIFRLAYQDPEYVDLARRAGELWRELGERGGTQLLHPTGGFDCGPAEELQATVDALISAGATYELLSDESLSERTAQFSLPQGWEAIFQPDAGVIAAREALETFRRLAEQSGAHIYHHRRILCLIDEGDHIAVETDNGAFRAEVVVVCGGGWSAKLLESFELDIPVRVTREHIAYYGIDTPASVSPFIWHCPGEPQFYGLPRRAGSATAKIGHHLAGDEVAAGSRSEPDPKRVDHITSFVREHLPTLRPEPVMAETCLYASTPDDDFILDRHERIVMGAGLGGHGFKFGPLIGAMLADLVESKPNATHPRFALSRFKVPVGAG